MTEKKTLAIICPQLKEKQLIEICSENLGWQIKYYESVSEALPYLSEHSVERIFLDFSALTDFHYDVPRIESCTNENSKIFLCFKNSHGLITHANPKIKLISENFSIAVFLREMVGDKKNTQATEESSYDLIESVVGGSAAVKEARRFCEKAKGNLVPILICGSVGSGKRFLAKTISQLDETKKQFVEISLLDLKNLYSWENVNYMQIMEVLKVKIGLKNNLCVYLKDFQVLDRNNQVRFLEKFEKNLLKEFQLRQIRVIFSSTVLQPDPQVYDYFYKNLKSGVLVIPDLNTRKRDIISLFEFFLKQYNEEGVLPQINQEVYSLLENYSWPNNVKELKLVAAQVSINSTSGVIKTIDLPEYLQVKSFFIAHSNVLEETPRPLEAFEAYYIVEILKSVNGNISKAARQLGVTRNTIKSKLKKADGILSEDFAPLKMLV